MLRFAGKGFLLKDGKRRCESFKVYANDLKEAAYALNTAAGWLRVKPKKEKEVLGEGVAVERITSGPEVHFKWPGQRGYRMVTELKRERGALRVEPTKPAAVTKRVAKNLERLEAAGGHRSTVVFSSEAWQGLLYLSGEFGKNRSATLALLIAEGVNARKAAKKR